MQADRQKHLLVIDWDFFFFNPVEAGMTSHRDFDLFDWTHNESALFVNGLWPLRAVSFHSRKQPLPTVNNEWRTFFKRFRFASDATLYFADSNTYAGTFAGNYDTVWLYDAHHDCGYRIASYREWRIGFEANQEFNEHVEFGKRELYDCSNWMLVHQYAGARLQYRFPRWHSIMRREGPRIMPGVNVVANMDSPSERPAVTFDDVFICRSGGWVPPWCDDLFLQFLDRAPVKRREQMDTGSLRRPYDDALARDLSARETNLFVCALGGDPMAELAEGAKALGTLK